MGLTNKHEKEVVVPLAVILFACEVSRASFLFFICAVSCGKNIFKKGKNKNRKKKKESFSDPAAVAARPKSNAIKEGFCAVGCCVYGGIFWPCQTRWLLCVAAELRGFFIVFLKMNSFSLQKLLQLKPSKEMNAQFTP